MNIAIGAKIRTLRKEKNISQEVLAQYLGVSFQAVSKWENGSAMPDVAMIPALAFFFGVSTDELFDYNTFESEQKVQQLCWDIADVRKDDPQRAEQLLRDLLRQYPGNDIILNNLIYTIQEPSRYPELIGLCKTLIASTKQDDIRYDAARIMAETYKAMGEYTLCKEAIDLIPEFFFTHREEKALLLEGEDMFRPAWQQKEESADTFIGMALRIADYYIAVGDKEKADRQLGQICAFLELLKDDETPPFWRQNYYQSDGARRLAEVEERRKNI